MSRKWMVLVLAGLILFGFPFEGQAQRKKRKAKNQSEAPAVQEAQMLEGLEYRLVGPFRGGRSAAVTGVPGHPKLFYMGATGGGVWRTTDAGNTWENISDGFFGGSIGAVAVSEYDPNVIYVGGGEVTVRGNVSYGYGMWKSLDAGKTWTAIGLENSRHIPRVRIHPQNPDLVYAAVLGDLFKSSEERGVYRSKDGGQTWEKILYANADAGAVDLAMDPNNPRILFASTWRVRRTPYSLESGGEGSALWKSTDGGDTWTNISGNEGLPRGLWGISGVSVSAVNSNRVYAIIENANGGVFRSDDGGDTWRKTNQDRALRQRAWYYSRIYADPQVEDRVYVVNVRYHRSNDGGKSFEAFNAPHGDHHDLWIDPTNNQSMVIGDDGGAQVSTDAGESWSTYYNQPTAQFYRVTTDDHFPFRIYGAQQDNSTIRIKHRSDGYSIDEDDWEETAGGESAHIAPDPDDNEIVYGGSYGGFLTRVNHQTEEIRAVNVWPDDPLGHGAEDFKYRFQWNFPLFFSPHDGNRLYAASNHLHLSTDEGQSWEIISPDLTRNDPSKLGPSGGPITKDNTGVEYYCTIFAAAESPHEEGVIWAGSDDGLIHITRDGGENWENVTPPTSIMPEWIMINSVEVHPFEKGGLYVAATMYKSGDYQPYLYKTTDYGQTWTKITSGIDPGHFTRVLRADPEKEGLLYAGTESGMYVSFDDGANWQPFQLNLPVVPITDLAVKDKHLVVATQGRSFWILDDLSVLHQMNEEVMAQNTFLFQPRDSYRMLRGGQSSRTSLTAGKNAPNGVVAWYYLKEKPADSLEMAIRILDSEGKTIRSYDRQDKKQEKLFEEVGPGLNRFVWDLRYEPAETFEGMILWWGETAGPRAVPGEYRIRLVIGNDSLEQPFVLKMDPRSTSSPADLQAQFDFLKTIRDKFSETSLTIKEIRTVRGQLKSWKEKAGDEKAYADIVARANQIDSLMTEVEEALYQTKNQSRQDPLNYPIRLNNKLAHLASLNALGSFKPTDQDLAFLEEMTEKIDGWVAKWQQVKENEIPAFNQLIKESGIEAVRIEEDAPQE